MMIEKVNPTTYVATQQRKGGGVTTMAGTYRHDVIFEMLSELFEEPKEVEEVVCDGEWPMNME